MEEVEEALATCSSLSLESKDSTGAVDVGMIATSVADAICSGKIRKKTVNALNGRSTTHQE